MWSFCVKKINNQHKKIKQIGLIFKILYLGIRRVNPIKEKYSLSPYSFHEPDGKKTDKIPALALNTSCFLLTIIK